METTAGLREDQKRQAKAFVDGLLSELLNAIDQGRWFDFTESAETLDVPVTDELGGRRIARFPTGAREFSIRTGSIGFIPSSVGLKLAESAGDNSSS